MSEAEMAKLLAEAARAFLAAVNGATDAQLASGFLPPEAEDLRRALRVYDRSRPSQSDKRMSPEEAVRHLAAAIRGPGAGIVVSDGIHATCTVRSDGTVGIDLRPGFWDLSEIEQEVLLTSIIYGAQAHLDELAHEEAKADA